MKLVVFGLSITSSWGNGHATLWRGLCRALAARGHEVRFYERDVPYYAQHRDLTEIPGGRIILYPDWASICREAEEDLRHADTAMVTSYCPDALSATELVIQSRAACRCFYDLDTGVTLSRLQLGAPVAYIGPRGLRDFDLVLSYIGGRALSELQRLLKAQQVAPLYGSVDPDQHRPTPKQERFSCDLSYMGTYAEDRQSGVEALFLEPARRLAGRRFVLAGSLYPDSFQPPPNVRFIHHLPPHEHAGFYCSSRLTLNVTRPAMAAIGYCPSGRLFEAAACGVPIVSDWFEGLDAFFEPSKEILIAAGSDDVAHAIGMPDADLSAMARRSRERTLDCHTARVRAVELESLLARQMTSAVSGAR